MTDGKFPDRTYEPPRRGVPRRRWWEKQRFIIPIAVAILAPAVFFVAGLVASDGAGSQQVELSTDQTRGGAPAQVPGDTPAAASRPVDGPAADAGQDAPGAETEAAGSDVAMVSAADGAQSAKQAGAAAAPAVCQRILALREQFEMQGVNPHAVYLETQRIQRDAVGTPVAAKAEHAVRTMEDFVSGRTDTAAVVAAGGALVSAC